MKPANLVLKMSVLVLALSAAAFALPEEGEGSMQVVSPGEARILPLKHTEVKAEISGFTAEVSVTQVFANSADAPIEAVYVFPLPENAAVNDLTLTIGGRVIKGQIKKREEARQVYEAAKAQGKTAALLDQERPNIFTQSVANIQPGHEIRVTLKYLQDLAYDHGEYKFVFPMTMGPRYIPGAPAGKSGTGWSPDTDKVADASRITPPVVKPGQRSGRDISVEVKLDAGVEIKNIRSSSHIINITSSGLAKAEVKLSPEDSIPNKDFQLTYEPATRMVSAAALAHKDGKSGYFTLLLQPSADFPLSAVTNKELVIAIDVSGSMSGFPVETAKAAALKCLEGMNPGDTFQIMSFASGNQLHFGRPLKNTPANLARAREVIKNLNGGGGTEMLAALRTVLEFPKDPERLRVVLFMTDGFIGNDPELLAFTKEHLNNSRIFPLGVGSSVNRYLLEEMAVLGKGSVQYVGWNETPEKLKKVMDRFYDRVSRPVLTDLAVDWNGLDVEELSPSFIPDLFAGQPLLLHARYGKAGSAPVTIKGKMLGKPWKMTVNVTLSEKEAANAAQGPLWARSRITDLERLNLAGESADNREKIIALALEHKLVTRFTSFVAVDETIVPNDGKKPQVVPVESELPEGTRYEGFFGNGNAASAGHIGAAGRGQAMSAFSGSTLGAPASAVRGGYSGGSGGAYGQAKAALGFGSKGTVYSPSFFQSSSEGFGAKEMSAQPVYASAPERQARPVWQGPALLALGLLTAAVMWIRRLLQRGNKGERA